MSTRSIKIFTAVGVFVILTFVGYFFTTKNAAKPEVITIYKVTPIEPRGDSHGADPRSDTSLEKHAPHSPSAPGDPIHVHKTPSSENHIHDELEIGSHFDPIQEFPEDTESPVDAVLADEDFNSSEHIHRNLESLSTLIQEEFPDLLNFSQMTREEIIALPHEEKERIREQSIQLMNRFAKEIRDSFSQLSPHHLENILSLLQETYREQWGEEYAGKVIAEIRNHLK